MEIVKRVITEKTYDKNGKVVSEKTTEEHFKEKITITGEPFDIKTWGNAEAQRRNNFDKQCEVEDE